MRINDCPPKVETYSPGRTLTCKMVPSTGARTLERPSVVFACSAWARACATFAAAMALSGSQAPRPEQGEAGSGAPFHLPSCHPSSPP